MITSIPSRAGSKRLLQVLLIVSMLVAIASASLADNSSPTINPHWNRSWYQTKPAKGYTAGDPEHFIWDEDYFIPAGKRGHFEYFGLAGGATTLEFGDPEMDKPASDRTPREGLMTCDHTGVPEPAQLSFHKQNFSRLDLEDGTCLGWFRADPDKKDFEGRSWHERFAPPAPVPAAAKKWMLAAVIDFVRKVIVDIAAKCFGNWVFWLITSGALALLMFRLKGWLKQRMLAAAGHAEPPEKT